MQYVRPVIFENFKPDEFHSEVIADRNSGLDSCICILTKVPPGKGSAAGLHTHSADQLYYVLQGRMDLQVADQRFTVEPDNLVFIPAGSPHMNSNSGSVDETHFELIVPHPTSELFKRAEANGHKLPEGLEVVRPVDESKFSGGARWQQMNLADRSTGSNHVSFGAFKVPVGGSFPLHAHAFDQIYYVIGGTMKLQVGLEEYTAGPHTLVILPAGMPHRNWNDGTEPEYHLNLRVPEPDNPDMRHWDVPVNYNFR